jgi:serine protease Do
VEGARHVEVLLAVPPDGADQWRSILKPRGEVVPARIVGTDSEADLAVLKIDRMGLPALPMGNSDDLRQGQLVFAFGSPLGLTNSVSFGVVSSVARQLEEDSPMVYIQTDATINPGNSGGPLVSVDGRVVGINTSILSQSGGSEGIGFAVPSNIVSAVYNQIRRYGRVRRGEIGVMAQTITPILASGLKLPQNWGVIIADVFPGGMADRAGLRVNDIVLMLDGKVMENARQFDINIYQRSIGEIVRIEVQRGAQKETVFVGLNERPQDAHAFADLVNQAESFPKFGIFAVGISQVVTRLMDLRDPSGVLVAALAADAADAQSPFVPGDVIHEINGAAVDDLGKFRSAVAALRVGDAVVVRAERDGRYIFLAFAAE